jgi:hypothetical protein
VISIIVTSLTYGLLAAAAVELFVLLAWDALVKKVER